jgi:hypothetical protein
MATNYQEIKVRETRKNKEKFSFQRQIDIAEALDFGYYGAYRDDERIKKHKINYDLYNGRLDVSLYDDNACYTIMGEEVTLNNTAITHYPLISAVAHAKHGEMISMPFIMSIKDQTPLKESFEQREYKKLIEQYIQLNFIAPAQKLVEQKVAQLIPQEEMSMFSPEELQQLQGQVDQEVKAMNPEEIYEYMENDYRTPIAKQAQEVTDYLIDQLDIKQKQDEGAKHAIITGEEYYLVDVHNDDLIFDCLLPASVSYGGSIETEWVQDMSWAKIERYLSVEEATQKYAEYLSEKDWTEIYDYVEPLWGTSNHKNGFLADDPNSFATRRVMYELSAEGAWTKNVQGSLNYKTKEGSSNLTNIYSRILSEYGPNSTLSSFGIREATIYFRDKMMLKRVKRMEDGIEKKYWFGEHYRATEEDISVREVWVDEVWRVVKLGTKNNVYVKVEPVQYQFRSLTNYKCELPIYGRAYNTHRNMSRNVSLIDLGKPYQKEYDTEMHSLKHDLGTNLGKVFIFLKNLKPQEQSWQEFLTTMKDFGIVFADTNQKGINAMDPNLMKSVDVSKMPDVAARIQLLESIRQNLYRAMYSNEATLGQVGQYATNGNVMSQQAASSIQIEPFYDMHRQIVEKAVGALVNKARLHYKDHPEKIRNILSPSSYAELEAGLAFWYTELGVSFDNSGRTLRQVEAIKAQVQALIQNSFGPEFAIELMAANSISEIANIAKKGTKRTQELQQQQQEFAMAQQQQNAQLQMQLKQQQYEFEMQKQRESLQTSLDRAEIQSRSFQMANDVNQDMKSDLLEKAEGDREAQLKMHEDKMKIELLKLGKKV